MQNADNVGYSPELFGKNHRADTLISYAASFGNTTLERLKQYGVDRQIGRLLKRFDAVSVRDENSVGIVRALTGKEPFKHLDPALIGGIETMSWEENDEKGYVAVYAYPNRLSSEEGKAVKQFAEKRGLRVLSLCGDQGNCEFENVECCTPKEILPYISNADYVVTDTFHGTIFSLIYHIPFAVYCRSAQDGAYSNSEKLTDLLDTFHLGERLITKDNDLETVFGKEIDFEQTDAVRRKERTAAIEYLSNALSNG